MRYVGLAVNDGIATITLKRPKVNAINEEMVAELHSAFREAESDDSVRAVILTGGGSFFSFGFDIPGFMDYPKDSFRMFVTAFSELVKYVFGFPKPVIGALNGHAIAGGCVLALACDRRIMAAGKPKIALNELTLGVTIFTSIAEMLRFAIGARSAQRVLYSGKMYTAEEALAIGLVDEAPPAEEFEAAVASAASSFAAISGDAFRTAKNLIKKRVLGRIEREDEFSIKDFVHVWYEEETQKKLAKVEIRD